MVILFGLHIDAVMKSRAGNDLSIIFMPETSIFERGGYEMPRILRRTGNSSALELPRQLAVKTGIKDMKRMSMDEREQ